MASDDWSGGGDGGASWGDGGSGGTGGGFGGDSYTETSQEGWLGRIGQSLVGIPIGLLLVVGSVVLLFWNEGRSVRTAQGLAEGEGAVVAVAADRVDPADVGKLVHLSGPGTTDEVVADPVYGVAGKLLRLVRDVQMYQWKEDKDTKTRNKLGGGRERVTTYEYKPTWSDRPIESGQFHHPEGHANPPADRWPARDWAGKPQVATVGAFRLSPGLVDDAAPVEDLKLDAASLAQLPEPIRADYRLDDGRLYRGADPTRPEVGDVRVAFRQVRPGPVSLLAKLDAADGQLGPFATKAGTTIERLQPGDADAKAMFQAAESENRVLAWILRGVGFGVMGIGFCLVLNPLQALAEVVPILGNLVGLGIVAGSFAVALVGSLVVIGIGWIAYRPVLGVAVLAGAAALLWLLGRKRRPVASPQ